MFWVNEAMKATKRRIPGVAQRLPVKRDMFGAEGVSETILLVFFPNILFSFLKVVMQSVFLIFFFSF